MSSLRKLAKRCAQTLPPLRQLFEQRDEALRALARYKQNPPLGRGGADLAAIDAFLETFAFAKPDAPPIDSIDPSQRPALAIELGWRTLARGVVDAIAASNAEAWFKVRLNGVAIELPRYTLMTMRHCIFGGADRGIELFVETAHWERMKRELTPGALFLDIGAATGAMSAPFSLAIPHDIRMVAFEPSRRARGYLAATVARNGAKRVTIMPCALSDAAGSFEFLELPEDETGRAPFLPETSRLKVSADEQYSGASSYKVDVSTLDDSLAAIDMKGIKKIVMKIDVEGFEDKVLLGARQTIGKFRPMMAIDIHSFPGKNVSTAETVISILKPYGYSVEKLGHVLIFQPN